MKNIYLYGASDDCCECETDFGLGAESYYKIKINDVKANYIFNGDWGIWLTGDIPKDWVITAIRANCPREVQGWTHGGQFIHIQVPDDAEILLTEIKKEEEQNNG